MFCLREIGVSRNSVMEVESESLSSYDLTFYPRYSSKLNYRDKLSLRYEGEDGESLFELVLSDCLLVEIGLKVFSGRVINNLDYSWHMPELQSSDCKMYCLSMNDDSAEVNVGARRVDLKKNFEILVYSDSVVFLLDKKEVTSATSLSNKFYVLLDDQLSVIGFCVKSKKIGQKLLETYG